VYWLGGVVGIGHHQGLPLWFKSGGLSSSERQLIAPMLEQGYAVVSSFGQREPASTTTCAWPGRRLR